MSSPARILVVDDSVVVRGLVSRIVDAEDDLEVASTAPDGRVALQKVERFDPDLVILDMEMPVMPGLEALDELQKSRPALPVVVFSVHTGPGTKWTRDALDRGAAG